MPDCGATSPEITSSVVVLPEPLAPINPTMDPGAASNVTSLTRVHAAEAHVHTVDAEAGRVHRDRALGDGRHRSVPSATTSGATGGPAWRELSRSCAARIPTVTRSPERCSNSANPPGR